MALSSLRKRTFSHSGMVNEPTLAHTTGNWIHFDYQTCMWFLTSTANATQAYSNDRGVIDLFAHSGRPQQLIVLQYVLDVLSFWCVVDVWIHPQHGHMVLPCANATLFTKTMICDLINACGFMRRCTAHVDIMGLLLNLKQLASMNLGTLAVRSWRCICTAETLHDLQHTINRYTKPSKKLLSTKMTMISYSLYRREG